MSICSRCSGDTDQLHDHPSANVGWPGGGPLTRRQFIWTSIMATAGLVTGCSSEQASPATTVLPSSTAAAGAAEPVSITDGWELLDFGLEAVRRSPDNRPARLAAVAADGTPADVLDWVRNHIRAMPDSPDGFRDPMAPRWGSAGVLRGGLGTPRDVAELLTETYRIMGLDAHVVSERQSGPLRDPMVVTDLPFEPSPPLPPDLVERFGSVVAPLPDPVDADLVEEIAQRVLDATPTDLWNARFVSGFEGTLPVVAFTDGQGVNYVANLWTDDGGLTSVDSLPKPVPEAEPPEVAVRLMAMGADDIEPVSVAELTVGLPAVIGRQVRASFAPTVESVLDLSRVRPADATTFLPTLRVVGDPESVVAGDPVTVFGERLEETPDGFATADGRRQITSGGDPSAVTSVEIIRVDTRSFPMLSVQARVQADGPIDGIVMDDIAVTENGQPVSGVLRSNVAAPRRIVFLTDSSRSVPSQYRARGAADVARLVSQRLLDSGESVEFRAATIDGPRAKALGNWTNDPEELARKASGPGSGSHLWEAFAYTDQAFAPDVIVFLTDGIAVDDDDVPVDASPEAEATIRSGAVGVVLGAGDLGPAFAGIAEMSGGVAVNADDTQAGVDAVLDAIASLPVAANYEIGLTAPADATGDRTVALAVGSATGERPYTVPVESQGPDRAALINISLEVEAMGMTVRRTLAGLQQNANRVYDRDLVDDRLARDVRLALFGSYAMSIEAGSVSPSQQLEQMILARQSMRPVVDATSEEELEEALAQVSVPSDHAFAFTAPLANGEHTHELAFRAWLDIDRRTQTESGERRLQAVDILPFTLFDSAVEQDSFARTAVASATLAVLEAGLFDGDGSTAGPEGSLAEAEIDDRDLSTRLGDAWPRSVFLAGGGDSIDEVWAVNRGTGTLTTVLADTTGGTTSVSEVNKLYNQIDSALELAGIVNGVPTSISLWAGLERAKLAKLRVAAIAILTMGGDLQVGDTGFGDEGCEWLNKGANWFAGSAARRVFGNAAMDAVDEALSPISTFNDWGSYFGFGDSGIPTDFSLC